MNLKQEINRTETNKNKTKQVAINIDNKLVELGGEQATDLSDVVNKMGAMVTKNYKKVAVIDFSSSPIHWGSKNGGMEMEFPKIPINVDFQPKRAILTLSKTNKIPNEIYNVEVYDNIQECQVPNIYDSIPDKDVSSIENINRFFVRWKDSYLIGNIKFTREYIRFEQKRMYSGFSAYVMKVVVIG